MVEDILEF